MRFFRKIKNLIGRFFRIRKIILIPTLVVIIGLVTFGIIRLVDYSQYVLHDPEFCLTCHIMEDAFAKWETSEHADVECHGCHVLDVGVSVGQLFKYAFGDYEVVTTHAEVSNELCLDCHQDNDSRWTEVSTTAGHVTHTQEYDVQCTDCHSSEVHRFTPARDVCIDCHSDITHGEGYYCTACHDFD